MSTVVDTVKALSEGGPGAFKAMVGIVGMVRGNMGQGGKVTEFLDKVKDKGGATLSKIMKSGGSKAKDFLMSSGIIKGGDMAKGA